MTAASNSPEPGIIQENAEQFAKSVNELVLWEVNLGGTGVPIVVLFLFLASFGFTIYLKAPGIFLLRRAIRIVSGRERIEHTAGEVTHFQALTTAIAGTVGIGNIANVAVAIGVGGPGAIFWMILAGLLGASSKMMECTLGVKFRVHHEDGSISGGPMYYLRDGLKSIGYGGTGRVLAYLYASCILIAALGIGNMFQSNQAYEQVVQIAGGKEGWLAEHGFFFGLLLAIALGLVIVGGIKSIARVTEKLVPMMAVLYVSLALLVIAMNAEAIPYAIGAVISGAFTPEGVAGGIIGVAVQGIKRSVFSNEAGLGTASVVHSAVQTNYPASEGIVSVLEPIIDTVVICTITGMVIVTGTYRTPDLLDSGLEGIEITSAAFAQTISFSPFLVSVAAVLFAFSTLIGWSYYGLKAWTFLFGKAKWGENLYKLLFCSAVVVGCMISLKAIVDFSDAMVFLLVIPNLTGLILLGPIVKKEVATFLSESQQNS